MLKIVWLGLLLAPLVTHGAEGDAPAKVYRWVGKDGVSHFSSTPPPGVQAKEMELQEPNMVIHQDNRTQLLNQSDRIGERLAAQQAQREALQQQIDEASVALDEARRTLATGKEPLPEEVRPIIGRGIRLTEEYYKRRESEARQVTELEQQVNALYEQLNALR